jgi:hypothetical protein
MALVLVIGLLCLGAVSVQTWSVWQSLQQARAQSISAKLALEVARKQRTSSAAPLSLQADTAAATEAHKLVRGLHPAWSAALLPVEDLGSPELRWLGLDMAADSGAVRLKGVSIGLEPIMRAMERLSHHRGWTQIALTRLQAANNLDPTSAVQFELSAQFDPGVPP